MPDVAPKADLLRSMGSLARGLSTLFWSLPITLVIFGLLWLHTVSVSPTPNALTEWLQSLSILPPALTTALLFYGLMPLSQFQPQERIWQRTVERARILALVNFGLSPFLYWWTQTPEVDFFAYMVNLLFLTSLVFLICLNNVIDRLAAMLPDETVRAEARLFTSINNYLLGTILVLALGYLALLHFEPTRLPMVVARFIRAIDYVRQWLFVALILVPVAMTMTLIWKIKEVILESVFNSS